MAPPGEYSMNNEFLPIFVGYDPREDIAYKVCEFSIYKNTPNAEVKPLIQDRLRKDGYYTRPIDPLSSTEFTFTRFLVPQIMNLEGWALFCDCDFIWDGDIQEIFDQADPQYAVMVVKHNHQPNSKTKMDGKEQTQYPRKNWSSMILWNCNHPSNSKLTLEDVNTQPGSYLHRFQWLADSEIGELNVQYNFLVGYNKPEQCKQGKPFAYHWTEGGPWFPRYMDCEHKNVWYQYLIDYSNELGRNNVTAYSPITWVTSLSREYYEYCAKFTMPTWARLPGDVVIVWDDKPIDLGFGKIFNFWKDVASPEDPWIKEGMGGTKADRFWKKSRVQVWAARRFKGLVVWIDADIAATKPLTRTRAIELLHPGKNAWTSLDAGEDWPDRGDCPIDTGIVAFNSRHIEFEKFIKDYSLTWYNGDIFRIPQAYDHHAANLVRQKWPMTSLAPHYTSWENPPTEYISRFVLENSKLKDYFIHYLGIEQKDRLRKINDEAIISKKEKKK